LIVFEKQSVIFPSTHKQQIVFQKQLIIFVMQHLFF